jgi:Ca-activated chloride channel family protein
MKPVEPDADSQQQPVQQEQVPTIRVQTRLVNVAVNVVDKTGAPVGGLEKDDFEIAEDGKTQKIAYFDRESATPLSIVLAIDGSESVLRNERLEKNAARHFVNALLREQDELDLMDFSDTVREIVPFTNSKKRIESGLNDIQHGASTALYDAIYLASDRLSETRNDAGRRRVVVLITDGEDTAKRSRYGQALEQAQRAGAMVYSIIIVPIAADAGRNTGGEHALIQMAQDTGGKYYYVEDPKDLEPAFARVSDDLRTQYLLGYYAPQKSGDGAFRSIRVRLKDAELKDKYELRHRNGYYADGR